ncbi:MAG: acyl-[acyl-carrier-protein] thioesterase [Candidatus Avigastranaerophilus sp.]
MSNKYSETITIKYSETDQNLAMKPFALLNFLQDIAGKNAEDLGFGYSFMHPQNYAWFLIKYRMEFEEYPFDIQNLTLVTEPRGYNKIFAYRNFAIMKNEKTIAKISSMWSIIDTVKHSMIPVKEVINSPYMPAFEKNAEDLNFAKISPLTQIDTLMEFEVRYNDLDVNGHANNVNYIVWAFEPLTFDFKNTRRIKTLDIVYKKEAKYGEIIVSQIEFKNNTTIHCLKNRAGEDLCLIECEWEEIRK